MFKKIILTILVSMVFLFAQNEDGEINPEDGVVSEPWIQVIIYSMGIKQGYDGNGNPIVIHARIKRKYDCGIEEALKKFLEEDTEDKIICIWRVAEFPQFRE